jgi:acyl carrier protein
MGAATLEKIVAVFAQVFKNKGLIVPSLTAATVLDGSLGLESLDFAEIVVRLEAAFGTDPFARGVPAQVRTLGDLVALYDPSPTD